MTHSIARHFADLPDPRQDQGKRHQLSDMIVMAVCAVICAADVELCRDTSSDKAFAGFYSLDEVIGKQTTRAIPEGQAFRQEWVRQPLLVRRGEVVTLTALSAGIRVRTMARARDDGSLGELISVESLTDRKSFFARVAAVREVEVYGRAIRADGGGVSRVVRR